MSDVRLAQIRRQAEELADVIYNRNKSPIEHEACVTSFLAGYSAALKYTTEEIKRTRESR